MLLPVPAPVKFTRIGVDDPEHLLAHGHEAARGWTHSLPTFVAPGVHDDLGLEPDDPRRTTLRLVNPLSNERPLLRTSLSRTGEGDEDLTGVRSVRNPHLDALVMRADGGIRDVLQWNVEDGASDGPLFHGGQQRGGVGRVAEVVAELEGVDQG